MNKIIVLIIGLLLFPIIGISQTVVIKNILTKVPIENVLVSNRSQSIKLYSDVEGKVRLDDFEMKDLIYFSHQSYSQEKRTVSEIIENDYIVKMINEIMLPSIEIKPPRESVQKDFSTVRIEKISSSEMKQSLPQTSADMLQMNSNILVQKSQSGGGSPIVRGFEANKILLVIDGVRLNNAIYRGGHLQNSITIDNNIFESTDIFYGPGSVIYGSDALGGVIHFHTKNPELSRTEDPFIKTNFMSRFGTANGENTNHVHFNYGRKRWASLTSVTFSDFEDFKMGENRRHGYEDFGRVSEYIASVNGKDSILANPDDNVHARTGYNQLDLLQKLTYQINDELNLGLNIQYSESSEINRFDKLNERRNGELRYAEWYYGPQKRLLTALKLESKKQFKLADYFTIIGAFQKIDEDRISRQFQNTQLFSQNEDVFVYSLNADFLKKLSEKEVLYYGVEISHNDVTSSATEKNIETGNEIPTQTRYPNGENRITSAAFYASMDKKIYKKLTATFGARYSYFVNYSTLNDNFLRGLPFNEIDFNTGAPSGSISLKYKDEYGFRAELIGSSGFRSPNVDDYGKVFEKDGNLVVPNNSLRPEYVYNYELNLSKSWERKEREYLALKVAGFYTAINDAIVKENFVLNGQDSILFRGETVNLESNQNVTSAMIYGGSFDAKLQLSTSLSFSGSINYIIGRNLTDETNLSHIPPVFGRFNITYTSKKLRVQLNSMFNAKKDLADYGPGTTDNPQEATADGTPAWTTFGLNASYNISEKITLQGSIGNIFDIHYKQFASGISGLGRNFTLAIRGNF
ncbi:MAG: TonB-dependent receptor [Flavobacteriales bacterium]